MAGPTLSVAMCTYNGAQYLQEQLDSIVTQERQPDELVVCDDASTDATPELVRRFAGIAPFPVRLYVNDVNLRSTKNFEQAIRLCSGEVIALADQDDIWLPRKLAALEERLLSNPRLGAVFSDAEMVDEALRPIGYRLWRSIRFRGAERKKVRTGCALDVLLNRNIVTGATMAFRAAQRELVLPIPAEWVHDGWIAVLIATRAELDCVDEPLIRYRQHARQQLGAPRRTLAGDTVRVITERVTRSDNARRAYVSDLARYRQLLARVDTYDGTDEARSKIEGKIAHLEMRADLPADGLRRAQVVFREVMKGHYSRYSRAWKSALKDLFARGDPCSGPNS